MSTTLSGEEIKYSESFIFQRDRYRYQITHYMERLILANYLDCDPKDLQFEIGKQGKPLLTHFQNSLNIQFNGTHSHQLILMAVTREDEVGIDVEYIANSMSIENLEVIFSPLEKQFF